MLHDVAVVGDHVERHALARGGDQRDLEEARHAGVEDAEAIAARADVEIGLPGPVDRHPVAEEAVGVEDVEIELPVGVPRLVGDRQIDVIVAVAPVEMGAAGEAQIDVVAGSA
jgi:hypothetical protein